MLRSISPWLVALAEEVAYSASEHTGAAKPMSPRTRFRSRSTRAVRVLLLCSAFILVLLQVLPPSTYVSPSQTWSKIHVAFNDNDGFAFVSKYECPSPRTSAVSTTAPQQHSGETTFKQSNAEVAAANLSIGAVPSSDCKHGPMALPQTIDPSLLPRYLTGDIFDKKAWDVRLSLPGEIGFDSTPLEVKPLPASEQLVIYNDDEVQKERLSNRWHPLLREVPENRPLKVAVAPLAQGFEKYIDRLACVRSLGGWDFMLHLYFSLHAVPLQEADFVYVPFNHYCFISAKAYRHAAAPKRALQLQLRNTREYIAEAMKGVPCRAVPIVPLSHDFGACVKYNLDGYRRGFDYAPYLRSAIILQANGDLDEDCYDPHKDVVVPALASIPTFSGRTYSLLDIFSDESKVRSVEQREVFVFGGFSEKLSQRREGVRSALMDPPLWEPFGVKVELNKAKDIDSYVRLLNNSVFCLVPPGVVGWTGRIWEHLTAGCIPVLIVENTRFPFERFVDYNKFTLRFNFDEVSSLPSALISVSTTQRQSLQREGMKARRHFLWPSRQQVINGDLPRESPIKYLMRELNDRLDRLRAPAQPHISGS